MSAEIAVCSLCGLAYNRHQLSVTDICAVCFVRDVRPDCEAIIDRVGLDAVASGADTDATTKALRIARDLTRDVLDAVADGEGLEDDDD